MNNNEKVSIDDFTNIIADQNGLSKQQSKDFINICFEEMGNALVNDDNLKISSFGSFSKKNVKERPGVNPQTLEKITIPQHNKIVFKPYKQLSKLVNKKYKNLQPSVIDAMLTLTGITKINPDYLKSIENDSNKKNLWERAKKRALFVLAIISILFLLILASLITIPIVINENNKVVQYVNSINKIFGINKITDHFKGDIDQKEVDSFFKTAKVSLTEDRAILEEYTVQAGDSIYSIASRYWGNEYLWPDLYITNKDKINDPDLIRLTDKLVIYEKIGDPENFSKKQKDNIVQSYIGLYRIYKALGENEISKGNVAKGNKRIIDSRWTLYTAVRYDHKLLKRYEDAIYPDDSQFVQKQIDINGYMPKKKM